MNINSCIKSDNIIELNNLLNSKATPQLTFFGKKVVKIEGYEGSISLNRLILNICQIALTQCFDENLTLNERKAGLEICENFKKLQATKIKANWFSTFLNKLREISIFPSFENEFDSCSRHFRAYSDKQLNKELYSYNLDGILDCKIVNPNRTVIKEEILRAL